MIPYSRQDVSASDIRAVVRILRGSIIARGPVIAEFEKAIARKVGARYAVAFTSGTAALHGAYFAAGVGKGDEVITAPLTFASTANTALWQGAKVVFADVDPRTGNIDPREVEKKITKKTKVITAVDYGGLPCDLTALCRIAKKHSLVLIEDAAHALGASYKGKPIGSIADMTMFSFHPVKPITAGEAGVITTNNEKFYELLKMFRNHGMTRDRRFFATKDAPAWHYEMHYLGLNYWLTDFQAALGISQLKRLGSFRKKRVAAASLYEKALSREKNIILPHEAAGYKSAWHLYALRLAPALAKHRDEIVGKLHDAGIGAQVHYIPVYVHPFYKKLGYKKGLCPNAEAFAGAEISIPLFPSLTTGEQSLVIRKLRAILATYE